MSGSQVINLVHLIFVPTVNISQATEESVPNPQLQILWHAHLVLCSQHSSMYKLCHRQILVQQWVEHACLFEPKIQILKFPIQVVKLWDLVRDFWCRDSPGPHHICIVSLFGEAKIICLTKVRKLLSRAKFHWYSSESWTIFFLWRGARGKKCKETHQRIRVNVRVRMSAITAYFFVKHVIFFN